MEAPEKLYLIPNGLISYRRNTDEDVEYISKDAFIEKVCNLLGRMIWEVTYEDLEGESTQHYDKMEFIEDFKNYIKRE